MKQLTLSVLPLAICLMGVRTTTFLPLSFPADDSLYSDTLNATTLTINPDPYFTESFETHTPIKDPGSQPFNLSGDNNAVISTEHVLDGTRSIHCRIPFTPIVKDPRSELRHKGGTGTPTIVDWRHPVFTTRTFIFSYYFSNDFQDFDPIEETIMQWKNQADPGCDIGSPPFSIRLQYDDIKYNIKYDETACTDGAKTVFGDINTDLMKGVWHHFVVEIHYDYREVAGEGYLKIWYSEDDAIDPVNDLVLDYNGPVGYNDQVGPYLKMGIYKSAWKSHQTANRAASQAAGVTERELWIDAVTVVEGPWVPGKWIWGR